MHSKAKLNLWWIYIVWSINDSAMDDFCRAHLRGNNQGSKGFYSIGVSGFVWKRSRECFAFSHPKGQIVMALLSWNSRWANGRYAFTGTTSQISGNTVGAKLPFLLILFIWLKCIVALLMALMWQEVWPHYSPRQPPKGRFYIPGGGWLWPGVQQGKPHSFRPYHRSPCKAA